MITGPLRDRFGLVARLDYYDDDELQQIVVRAGGILDVTIDEAGAWEIARRSRGTPRIANRLLRRVRDFAEVRADGEVTADIARDGLALFGVDDLGLDKIDRAILNALCRQFGGGPVGLSTLAISVGELRRDGRGRVRTVPHPAGHVGPYAAWARRAPGRLHPRRPRRARPWDRAPARPVRLRSSQATVARTGRCSPRNAIVFDHADLAAASL